MVELKIFDKKNSIARKVPERIKTIKVDIRTWDSLKSLKKEDETFNDVIKGLLNQRTKSAGNDSIKAIRYKRKTSFIDFDSGNIKIGIEYDYNDSKGNKEDFILDLKIKKIFYKKKTYQPSEFFGVDNNHKHYSEDSLVYYFFCVGLALMKEFRINIKNNPANFEISEWRKLYYDYRLSEESFKEDIEEPLRLSEDEKPSKEWVQRIKKSISNNLQ